MLKLSCAKIRMLLTIYRLAQKGKEVRSMDIAAALSISRPTVSRTTTALAKLGYLENQPRQDIRLSGKGVAAAKEYQLQYESLQPLFSTLLHMKSVDAHECTLSLLGHLSDTHITNIGEALRKEQGVGV